MPLQVLSVIREVGPCTRLDVLQRVGERHFAAPMMVAVGLTIGCDMNYLRPGSFLGKSAEQTLREAFPIVQQPLKSHAPGNRPVVKEEVDGTAGRQPQSVRHGGIDTLILNVPPHAAP